MIKSDLQKNAHNQKSAFIYAILEFNAIFPTIEGAKMTMHGPTSTTPDITIISFALSSQLLNLKLGVFHIANSQCFSRHATFLQPKDARDKE